MVTRENVLAALALEDDVAAGHLFQELLAASSAGDEPTVSRLLHEGADGRHQDSESGLSALMAAARGGHEGVVRLLLQHGVRCCLCWLTGP